MPAPDELVTALTAKVRPLEIAANQAWWLASTAVSDEHERRRVATDLALRDALGDVHTFAGIREALARPSGDPLVRRQLEVLHDRTLPHQVPADLRAEMVELKPSSTGRSTRSGATSTVAPSTTTRSRRSCARATTAASVAPRGRPRSRSGARSPTAWSSSPGSATAP